MPVVALILALVAVVGVQDKIDAAEAKLESQREGRRIAVEVLCGGLYGVEDAGRRALTDTLPPPAPVRSRPSREEQVLRERYAEAYAAVISRRVIEEAGVDGRGVLRDDGTIDCDKLKTVASAQTPTTTPTAR